MAMKQSPVSCLENGGVTTETIQPRFLPSAFFVPKHTPLFPRHRTASKHSTVTAGEGQPRHTKTALNKSAVVY